MRSRDWAKALFAVVFIVVAGGLWGAEAGGTNRFAGWIGKKIYDGRLGPWLAEARLLDPKAQIEEAGSSGKILDVAPPTYRLVFLLGQSRPKTPLPIAGEKGTVTVTGPTGKREKTDLAWSRGDFGTDVALEKPGTYEFNVEIESGGKKGTTTFAYTVK